MKKVLSTIFILGIIAVCLSACTNEPITPKNKIAPMEVTQEQRDIVDLLSSDKQEILLFDYTTEEAYRSVEFWVEVYEYGVLVDRSAGVNSHSNEANPHSGQLAIVITQNPDFQWTFTTSENGTRTSHTSDPSKSKIEMIHWRVDLEQSTHP